MLALAPLDVWARLIARSGGVGPRYWLRLAGVLLTSTVGTVATLPERVLVWLWLAARGGDPARFDHPPGVIVVAGYYRSGTTHVHNLLACDPGVVTPRWAQAMAPQGFRLSWWLTRLLLVPFVGGSRPQDAVGFGPMWPGEDDFALAGWGACSTLPGRLVFPRRWGAWSKWNTLGGCTDRERARWRRTMARFAWKVTRGHRDRVLVLKTPSHGAHLGELRAVFGDRLRVVHVTREPGRVVDSNMRMHHALRRHALGDPIGADALRARIVDEYVAIERATRDGRAALEIPSATLAHERVVSDPVGALAGALDAIGAPMTDAHAAAVRRYLASLGAHEPDQDGRAPLGTPGEAEADALGEIRAIHRGLDAGAPVAAPGAVPAPAAARARVGRGVLSAVGTALACAAGWIAVVWVLRQALPHWRPRLDQLVWLMGALIGLGAARGAGVGTRALGVVSAALTPVIFVAVSFVITVVNWNWAADGTLDQWLYHNTKGTLHGVSSSSSLVFAVLGAVTAYRHGSDDGPRAPGA